MSIINMSAGTPKIKWALQHAARGFRIIPLHSNSKIAARDNWPAEATSDPDVIKRWWTEHPNNNIGIVGHESLVILDEDNKSGKNGHHSLMLLELNNTDIPPTLTSVTPTGGKHYFLKVPAGFGPIGNSAGKLGEGLDIRGVGGYVVAPGSVIGGKAYQWAKESVATIAECPRWVATSAGIRRSRNLGKPKSNRPLVTLDTADTVRRATTWLQHAEPATQGAGGDQRTYITAAHLKDMGLSEGKALELMLDHWNDRCEPLWMPEALLVKVSNAYGYGQNAPGAINPNADFPVEHSVDWPTAVESIDPTQIPPRQFILGHIILRSNLTLLVSPPGAGKTTLVMGMALAVATGRSDITGFEVKERTKVWYYNGEDDRDELNRRLLAAMQQYSVTWDDLRAEDGSSMLHLDTGQEKPLALAKYGGAEGKTIISDDGRTITERCLAKGIGLLILDPLIELHQVEENDNGAMAEVAGFARKIAWDARCGVLIPHHTRKHPEGDNSGHAGNMDSGRGAGSIMGKARVALTLYSMSAADVKKYKIPDDRRQRYVRLDDAKNNLALIDGAPRWFERTCTLLGGLDGQEVGTLVPIALEKIDMTGDENASLIGRAIADEFDPSESELALTAVCERLHAGANPFFTDRSADALKKLITRAFDAAKGRLTIDAGTLILSKSGKATSPKMIGFGRSGNLSGG